MSVSPAAEEAWSRTKLWKFTALLLICPFVLNNLRSCDVVSLEALLIVDFQAWTGAGSVTYPSLPLGGIATSCKWAQYSFRPEWEGKHGRGLKGQDDWTLKCPLKCNYIYLNLHCRETFSQNRKQSLEAAVSGLYKDLVLPGKLELCSGSIGDGDYN